MADIERGTPLPTKRRWLALPVFTLLFGVLLGLVTPHPYRWQWAVSTPVASLGPAEPFVLSEWEYPEAKSLSKLEGGSSLYAYSTPDALETVWGHYAKLSGIDDKQFKPGTSHAKTDFAFNLSSVGASGATRGVLYYTGDHDRRSVRSANIVTQRPDYTVAVFVSRGQTEDQPHINIVVEKKSGRPAS
jgi:hypothetical protein